MSIQEHIKCQQKKGSKNNLHIPAPQRHQQRPYQYQSRAKTSREKLQQISHVDAEETGEVKDFAGFGNLPTAGVA
jgi:hypothetical protein